MKKNDQVKHLFCGHTHRNSKGQILSIPASTSPSIAIDLRLGEASNGAELQPVFQIHKFDGTQFKSKTVVCEILAEIDFVG